MKRIIKRSLVALLVVSVMLSLTGCVTGTIYGKPLDPAEGVDLSQGSIYMKRIMNDMIAGTLEDIDTLGYHYGQADAETFEEFGKEWALLQEEYGLPAAGQVQEAYEYGNEFVFVYELTMENGGTLMLQAMFSNRLELVMLHIYETDEEYEAKVVMPETILEIDITLDAGTGFPVPGKLTVPKEAVLLWESEAGEEGTGDGSASLRNSALRIPAAVLVPGDGANTMDMKAGSTRLYRDLAWALAEEGIATVRYDKRTYTYSTEVSMEDAPKEVFTVAFEYTEDANAAYGYLASLPYVDENSIYYIGHSQGAIVASRAEEELTEGSYAGYVFINTSPRDWPDVIYDQYINYGLIDRSDEEIYYLVSKLKTEKKFIQDGSIYQAKEDELTGQFPLGRAIAFWQDYESFDYVDALKAQAKPTLILQGGNDYQITETVDYAAWEEALTGTSFAAMKSYEGLNHLMVRSQGAFAGHYKEYDIPGRADSDFLKDVAAWILAR